MRQFPFGQYKVSSDQVFFLTKHSLALVNLKPIVPGHVLVIPRRTVERYHDLSDEECADLAVSVREVGKIVEREFKGESLNIAMQDGRAAGQSVYHVHFHILPRRAGDWKNNDDIYEEIEKAEKALPGTLKTLATDGEVEKPKGVDFDNRKPRTAEEMAQEATMLRKFFKSVETIDA